MSGPAGDRWRGGRPFDKRQPTQRNTSLGSRDRNSGPQGGPRGAQNANQPEQIAPGLAQERHVSMKGFNTAECKAALKRVPTQPAPLKYKPTGPSGKDAASNRASAPWGIKPNSMANNKDFFLEVRKQVAVLQQGGSMPAGG